MHTPESDNMALPRVVLTSLCQSMTMQYTQCVAMWRYVECARNWKHMKSEHEYLTSTAQGSQALAPTRAHVTAEGHRRHGMRARQCTALRCCDTPAIRHRAIHLHSRTPQSSWLLEGCRPPQATRQPPPLHLRCSRWRRRFGWSPLQQRFTAPPPVNPCCVS